MANFKRKNFLLSKDNLEVHLPFLCKRLKKNSSELARELIAKAYNEEIILKHYEQSNSGECVCSKKEVYANEINSEEVKHEEND